MDYARVVPLVAQAAATLSRTLSGQVKQGG
jgi:transcriptional regulator of heat shock response